MSSRGVALPAQAVSTGLEISKSGRFDVMAYAMLGLPLAFAALPIYVHVPRLYAEGLGLSLAAVGAVLLLARVLDALTDPLIGWCADRFTSRRLSIAMGLPLLAAGMVALLSPPAQVGAVWLAVVVFIVTLGYSVVSINYYAWGAELGQEPRERTRVVAVREQFALVGVVLAAALPSLLADDMLTGLSRLAWIFVLILALAAGLTLFAGPVAALRTKSSAPLWRGLRGALAHRPFVLLLLVFAANGIASAIPATTVLFFVADVLDAEAWSGGFLVVYFVAGAASLPLWVRISGRIGKLHAWMASMLLAMVVFVWAWTLGVGDSWAFGLICVLSGFALGADLALPPSILADMLARDSAAGATRTGACFGWWNFVTKANLALAAGLALPLLGLLGYSPGVRGEEGLLALAAVYALVPVALKALALALLVVWRTELDFEGALQ